jgi:1-acyl-sn-glycerol-3-phosphate acyltransferase
MGYTFVQWLVRVIMQLIARVDVSGWENLPKSGSYIAVSNHNGRLEVLLVFYLLKRKDVILIVAEKYRSSRFWRWFTRRVNGIFIDRYNADFGALREVLKRLEKGGVLMIAPEGTRSHTGALQTGYLGASFLAAKSGVLVIPVGATGTRDPEVIQNIKRLRRTHVCVRIGKPFTVPPLHGSDRHEQLQVHLDEIMCQIAALLPPDYRGVYQDYPRVYELIASNSENKAESRPGSSQPESSTEIATSTLSGK